MKIQVEGKQMDVGEALTKHVTEAIEKVSSKYFEKPIEVKVIFSKENNFFHSEILIHASKGINLQANAKADDAYPAFDGSLDVLEGRLRKYSKRLKEHHKRIGEEAKEFINSYVVEAPDEETAEHVVIAEIENPVETISVADAVMRLELAGLNALMFRNIADNKINMVYLREDGNIGWVNAQN